MRPLCLWGPRATAHLAHALIRHWNLWLSNLFYILAAAGWPRRFWGPRLQPAKPIDKSGTESLLCRTNKSNVNNKVLIDSVLYQNETAFFIWADCYFIGTVCYFIWVDCYFIWSEKIFHWIVKLYFILAEIKYIKRVDFDSFTCMVLHQFKQNSKKY